MSEVGGWITGLGLGQVADVFRDNLIDTEVLPRRH